MNFFLEDFKKNILLYSALFILISNYMIFTAFNWAVDLDFEAFKLGFRFFSFIFLVFYLFARGKIKKSLLLLIILTLILFIINNNEILLNILFMFIIFGCMYDLKVNNFLMFIFICYVFYFFIHNILFYSGVIYDGENVVGDRVRESFGFTNVNRLGIFYFYFMILCFYVFNEKKGFLKILSLIFLIISAYYILASDSRTALYCSVLLFAFYVFKGVPGLVRSQRFILNFTILIGALLSLYLASSSAQLLNEALSLRPYFFAQYFNTLLEGYNFIFGVPVFQDVTVDNSYILLCGAYGILISFLFFLVSPLLSFNKKISSIFSSMIIVILLYGVFESNLLRIEMLVPIFVFYSLFFVNDRNY